MRTTRLLFAGNFLKERQAEATVCCCPRAGEKALSTLPVICHSQKREKRTHKDPQKQD